MQQVMNEPLWVDDFEKGEIINALASAPPTYSKDMKTMTIKLRPGMLWSDGTEITADDLAFTVNFIKATPAATNNASVAAQVESAKAVDKTHGGNPAQESQSPLPLRELRRPLGQPLGHAQDVFGKFMKADGTVDTESFFKPSSTTRL